MTAYEIAQLVRWFPLVDRPRPTYPPLEERVAEVTSLARDLDHADDVLLGAARVLNRAALIASDCGMPELARELCWCQIAPYRKLGRLTIAQAKHMLEPVVNLARLRMRAGDAEAAWASISNLYQALRANRDAVIEDRPLPTGDLDGTKEEYQQLCEWAWRAYLAEGTRALVRLGRWREALTHVDQNKGIGLHLMDGRQVKIVNCLLDGNADAARTVLDASTLTMSWETQVAACLHVMCCITGDQPAKRATSWMIHRYLAGRPEHGRAIFRARLGLAVIDLAACAAPDQAGAAYMRLVEEAIASGDGYVAREMLAHDRCRATLSGTDEETLSTAVQATGFGLGTISDPLMTGLIAAVNKSATALDRALDTPAHVVHGHTPA